MKRPLIAAGLALALIDERPASALTIREFRKYPQDQQAVYISAAVSMTAYSYASGGDTVRARCIQDWYFGRSKEDKTPGPRSVAVEIAAAEQIDAAKYHVEGVILGLVDKYCPVERTK